MKIIFEDQDLENIIHSSLCNGGLNELHGCGVTQFRVTMRRKYKEAKKTAEPRYKFGLCREDVWWEILKNGKSFDMYDHEYKGDLVSFDLEQAKENFNNADEWGKEELMKILDPKGDDDAWTAFHAIQIALYGKVIYG